MAAKSAHPADRVKQLIGSQLAGPVLALIMVQLSAARGRRAPE